MKKHILLLLIIILAICIRFYKLGDIPEGLHSDEAAFGYNAYSLLKTGKDEYGKHLPFILRSFDDYKGAVSSYLIIPFVGFIGLNPGSIRIPSAVSGVLMVILVYLVFNEITKNSVISLIAAFVASINPTSIIVSRTQNDPLISVVLLFLGLYFFLKSINRNEIIYTILAIIPILLSVFTNNLARIFAPILILFLWIFVYKKSKYLQTLLLLVVFIVTVVLNIFFLHTYKDLSGTRYSNLINLHNSEINLNLHEQISEDGLGKAPIFITRLLHNKIIMFGNYVFHNYLSYFSFDFLFYQSQYPLREQVPHSGIFFLIELPFLFIGIYSVMQHKLKLGIPILLWILLAPVPLSLFEDETPNIHRIIISLVPFVFFIAYGIYEVYTYFKIHTNKYVAWGIISVLYVIALGGFLDNFFIHLNIHQPYYRGAAYSSLFRYIQPVQNKYDMIIFSKGNQVPYIQWLVYSQYDPVKYQLSGSHRDLDYAKLDNFWFVPQRCPSLDPIYDRYKFKSKVLFINMGECSDTTLNSRVLHTITWRNNLSAFTIVEAVATPSGLLQI